MSEGEPLHGLGGENTLGSLDGKKITRPELVHLHHPELSRKTMDIVRRASHETQTPVSAETRPTLVVMSTSAANRTARALEVVGVLYPKYLNKILSLVVGTGVTAGEMINRFRSTKIGTKLLGKPDIKSTGYWFQKRILEELKDNPTPESGLGGKSGIWSYHVSIEPGELTVSKLITELVPAYANFSLDYLSKLNSFHISATSAINNLNKHGDSTGKWSVFPTDRPFTDRHQPDFIKDWQTLVASKGVSVFRKPNGERTVAGLLDITQCAPLHLRGKLIPRGAGELSLNIHSPDSDFSINLWGIDNQTIKMDQVQNALLGNTEGFKGHINYAQAEIHILQEGGRLSLDPLSKRAPFVAIAIYENEGRVTGIEMHFPHFTASEEQGQLLKNKIDQDVLSKFAITYSDRKLEPRIISLTQPENHGRQWKKRLGNNKLKVRPMEVEACAAFVIREPEYKILRRRLPDGFSFAAWVSMVEKWRLAQSSKLPQTNYVCVGPEDHSALQIAHVPGTNSDRKILAIIDRVKVVLHSNELADNQKHSAIAQLLNSINQQDRKVIMQDFARLFAYVELDMFESKQGRGVLSVLDTYVPSFLKKSLSKSLRRLSRLYELGVSQVSSVYHNQNSTWQFVTALSKTAHEAIGIATRTVTVAQSTDEIEKIREFSLRKRYSWKEIKSILESKFKSGQLKNYIADEILDMESLIKDETAQRKSELREDLFTSLFVWQAINGQITERDVDELMQCIRGS